MVYEKLPQNKVFQEEPIHNINIRVKATGFKLLSSNFYSKDLVFNLNKIRFNADKQYYFLPKTQELIIQEQLYKGLQLDKILKDTVFLKLGSLASKKVPVKANLSINYEHGYDLTSPVKLTPDSVLISGPKLQIDKVKELKTALLKLDNVSKNKKNKVKIITPEDFSDLKISKREAEIELFVDKFTEGEFLVSFDINNLPKNIKINTFPKKVKVVFKVGLSNFNEITANSFKVVCDYKVSKENDLPYLIPKLELKSSLVSSARLDPNKIEFLTQK